MNPFKKLKDLENRLEKQQDCMVAMSLKLGRLEESIDEIKKKLPDYEEAVARGIDDILNKAEQEFLAYNPSVQLNKENSIK